MELNKLLIDSFIPAIRGMRNSFNSWSKMDTTTNHIIGENDLKLMKTLIGTKNGSERKFLRMMTFTVDINAPLYWWKQFDTYKVGTVANSTSTMHTITNKEFRLEDFEQDFTNPIALDEFSRLMVTLNVLRDEYLKTKNKEYWRDIILLLPSNYKQLRTVSMNYEVAYHIYFDRINHRLKEWQTFCNYLHENLPYFKEVLE